MTDIARELEMAVTAHPWARDEIPTLLKRAVREIDTLRNALAVEMNRNENLKGAFRGMKETAEKYNRAALLAFSGWSDGFYDYEGWTWPTGAEAGSRLAPISGKVVSDFADIIARKADEAPGHDLADDAKAYAEEQSRQVDLLDE